MYSSRGSNSYAHQSYGAQSSFGQTPTSAYPGSSASGAEGLSQLNVGSRHPSLLVGGHEIDIGAHRALPSTATHYGGQYSSLYNSASMSSGQKVSDYPSLERRQYSGRDLQPEAAGRFSDSVGLVHQPQSEIYDRIEQAVLREQLLKSQSLQSASHDSVARHADYINARSATTLRHPAPELDSYGVRVESDPRAISILSRSSYGGQPAPSILGAAPQRNVDDIVYAQSSSNPGYGVSLPPGRDYGTGKGLHRSSLEPDYPPRMDDRKDERGAYVHDLDLREAEHRRERLREREKERERERDREREREREKERMRDREKDRERKRILELRERERERDRERKRALEARRERTPPRVSKDRHSSLTRDSRLLRRDSPRHEALHRLRSPEKDKRRVYLCKVYTSSMVDLERDYMSVDKRYPRLYICPDFSKLLVNWPKESLKLSMRTPVTFEHDFVEEETSTGHKEVSAENMEQKSEHSGHKGTVWNAKVVLMSGLSRSAIEELSSDRNSDDRVPHICHLLKFAVLKNDRSFMAIGGQWDPIDGGNPSDDDSSLVRTALRHVKDASQLNLQNCTHWNRFLEIHYDRIGDNGLFSHKEVTVLFIPDLSNCLPSLDSWREQWLAHKKVVAEREKLLASKKEKAKEKKDDLIEKEINTAKDAKRSEKSEKRKETAGTTSVQDATKGDKVDGLLKPSTGDRAVEGSIKNPLKNDGSELADDGNDAKKDGDASTSQDCAKPKKKRVVRRIVKKVVDKKAGLQNVRQDNAGGIEKGVEDKEVKSETGVNPSDVKTFTRKKVTKKKSEEASYVKDDKNVESVKGETQQDSLECKVQVKINPDPSSAASAPGGPVKKTVKRKIIKRVPKKKAAIVVSTSDAKEIKGGNSNEHGKVHEPGNERASLAEAQVDEGKEEDVGKSGNDLVSSSQPRGSDGKHNSVMSSGIAETTADKVVQKEDGDKSVSEAKLSVEAEKRRISPMGNHEINTNKSKDKEKLSAGKGKEGSGKDEPRTRTSNDAERKKSEEPPRPGFILQTKSGKDTRLRSKTLSLDSLLDYSDKDVEESNFELSLFAESFYEMLQYQMGSRIFTFLQKLRIKFVTERNQRKRKREERKDMDNGKSIKRLKSEESPGEAATRSEGKDKIHPEGEKSEPKVDKMAVDENNKVKMEVQDVEKQEAEEEEEIEEEEEEEIEEEEDPEECPQLDEEMKDESPKADSSKQNDSERKTDTVTEPEDTSAQEGTLGKDAEMMPDTAKEESKEKADASKTVTKAQRKSEVDRELLQAFRFFDRNQAGYIRVEDMRLIIHSLGKCLSHRDVKELAQSALLESNTGRDDRILYEKLVRMSYGDKECTRV